MALNLSGLMAPPQEEEYVWFFDPAVDREKSDFLAWAEDGRSGLVFLPEQEPSRFTWAPLDPEQRDVVLRMQRASVPLAPAGPVPMAADEERQAAWARMVAAHGAIGLKNAVAFALRNVSGLDVPFQRISTPAGLRVSDGILRALSHPSFTSTADILVPTEETDPEAVVRKDEQSYRKVPITVSLIADLGTRILRASRPTEQEKKG